MFRDCQSRRKRLSKVPTRMPHPSHCHARALNTERTALFWLPTKLFRVNYSTTEPATREIAPCLRHCVRSALLSPASRTLCTRPTCVFLELRRAGPRYRSSIYRAAESRTVLYTGNKNESYSRRRDNSYQRNIAYLPRGRSRKLRRTWRWYNVTSEPPFSESFDENARCQDPENPHGRWRHAGCSCRHGD